MSRTGIPIVAKQLKVRRSEIAGRGVFTLEDIKRGEYILKTQQRSGWKFLRYLNHSCKPNARLETGKSSASDLLFAVKNIKEGTEITINYKKTRWAHYFIDTIEEKGGCLCPSCEEK